MFKDNVRSVLAGVCCAAVMCGGVSGVDKKTNELTTQIMDNIKRMSGCVQKWPSMALDGTSEHEEPKRLMDYHASRAGLGYCCFMPKNQKEMDWLYDQYKAGNFTADDYGTYSWTSILSSVDAELAMRLIIGDMYFIDRYIDHLNFFIPAAFNHSDRGFIGNLLFSDFGLFDTIANSGVAYADAMATQKRLPRFSGERMLTKEEALRVTTRLNDIWNETGLHGRDVMLNVYHFRSR
jgi:hypothetical protein